jgi:predicted nucleotidyltransferase
MPGPTVFPELNGALAELLEGARAILGENFCGAYLHGSFATGDADVFSDVDFMIVTHEELTDEKQAGLQAMHRRIYALETPWAQHLEGSYVPERRLRRVRMGGGADRGWPAEPMEAAVPRSHLLPLAVHASRGTSLIQARSRRMGSRDARWGVA